MCPSAHPTHQMKSHTCVLFVPPAYLLKVSIIRRADSAEYSLASFRHFMPVVNGRIAQVDGFLLLGFCQRQRVVDSCLGLMSPPPWLAPGL